MKSGVVTLALHFLPSPPPERTGIVRFGGSTDSALVEFFKRGEVRPLHPEVLGETQGETPPLGCPSLSKLADLGRKTRIWVLGQVPPGPPSLWCGGRAGGDTGINQRGWVGSEPGGINLVLLQRPQAGWGQGQGQGGLVLEHPRSGRTGPASPPGLAGTHPARAGAGVTPCPQGGTMWVSAVPKASPGQCQQQGAEDFPGTRGNAICASLAVSLKRSLALGAARAELGMQTNPGALQGNTGPGFPPAGNQVSHLPRKSSRSVEASAEKPPFFSGSFCLFLVFV